MSTLNKRKFLILLTTIAVAGLILRLYNITGRPIHYDEAVHGLYTLKFLHTGTYAYQGAVHGPVLYYISSIAFTLADPSIYLGRTLSAVVSLGMFGALYLLRDELDDVALLTAALLYAIHPLILYPARFYRNDILVVTCALFTIAFYAKYRRTPTRGLAIGVGVFIALILGLKEIGFLLIPILATPIALVAHFDARFNDKTLYAAVDDVLPFNHLLSLVTAFVLLFLFLYGGWPPQPWRAPELVFDGLRLWISRSDTSSAEPLFYIKPLVTEMTALFALSLIGCLGTLVKPRSNWLRWMFVAWAAGIGLLLSVHSHQWGWLWVHLLAPIAVLAGLGVSDLSGGASALVQRAEWSIPRSASRTVICLVLITAVVTPTGQSLAAGDGGVFHDYGEDTHAEAAGFAADQAENLSMPVVSGPNISYYPTAWHLRAVNHSRVDSVTQYRGDAVIITAQPMPELEKGASVYEFGGRRYVYIPSENGR